MNLFLSMLHRERDLLFFFLISTVGIRCFVFSLCLKLFDFFFASLVLTQDDLLHFCLHSRDTYIFFASLLLLFSSVKTMEFSHDITIAAESMGRERGVKIKNTEERVAGDSVWI